MHAHFIDGGDHIAPVEKPKSYDPHRPPIAHHFIGEESCSKCLFDWRTHRSSSSASPSSGKLLSGTLGVRDARIRAADGTISALPPLSKAGDSIAFRAHEDLVIGLTACSAYASNGGSFKPIDYRIKR